MRGNIEKVRENHLVAAALLQVDPNLKLISAESDIVDFFVELPIDESRFAIVTWPDKDFNTQIFADYLELLKSSLESLNGLPLIIACYDESHGLLLEILARWDFGECHINCSPHLKLLTDQNKDDLICFIRLQDSQIRILKDNYHKVVKSIGFEKDRKGIKCNAQMLYLRDFSPIYKMTPKPVKDENERFYRNLNGQPQDEYPHDLLDDSILNAVRKVYPDANVHNSLLITNSEYRKLLLYRRQQYDYAEFRFLPDLSGIPVELYPRLGKIEGASFKVDIYMTTRINRNAFANEGFDLRFPLDGWFDTLNHIVNQLQTMHSVSSMIS